MITDTNEKQEFCDRLAYGTCRGCSQIGVRDHSCPYDADVRNNPNSMCNCCKTCTQNCADDI